MKCWEFFTEAYISYKIDNDANGQTNESMSKFTEADFNTYLNAIETKSTQENKEHNEHIQQVTEQNATLLALVQEQQKNRGINQTK